MDLVQCAEIVFGAGFVALALIGSERIFGGLFYSKKVKAVVGEKSAKLSVRIDGQVYTGRHEMNLAERRDRVRHKRSGDRRKRTYNEHRTERVCFTYRENGKIYETSYLGTVCPVSTFFIQEGREYNIKVSRKKHWKARVGLFEILRVLLSSPGNIIVRLILCIAAICNALILSAVDAAIAAFGVWIICSALK